MPYKSIIFINIYLYFICVCMPYLCSVHTGQMKVLDPLELQLQAFASHLMGVLEIEINLQEELYYFLKCHLSTSSEYIPTRIKVARRPLSMGLSLVAILYTCLVFLGLTS